jgi:hypothetical protein
MTESDDAVKGPTGSRHKRTDGKNSILGKMQRSINSCGFSRKPWN